MRKNLLAISFLLMLFVSGCSGVPKEALTQANDNSLISDAFMVLVQKGETTREQEQAMLRANRRSWHAQNFALNNAVLPQDMQQPGNTGPLDANLLQSLESDLVVRANMQKLREILKREGVGSVNSLTGNGR